MSDAVERALEFARRYGGNDGAHHKDWVIDQMVRALTDCPLVERIGTSAGGARFFYEAQGESEAYLSFVADAKAGEDGPETYEWSEGIAP